MSGVDDVVGLNYRREGRILGDDYSVASHFTALKFEGDIY